MEFEQRAQEDLYARVATYLRQGFGDLVEQLDDAPSFIVELGQTRLLVSIDANGPERASVQVLRLLGEGLAVTGDVALYLIHKAHELPLATVGVDDEDRIWIRYILFAEGVTRENLGMLLRIFAEACVEVEDQLSLLFR